MSARNLKSKARNLLWIRSIRNIKVIQSRTDFLKQVLISKKFASYVKKRMKIAAADRGIVLEDFIVGHYFISGFFRKNEKWAYFSFDECRNSPLDFTAKDCWKGFLLRTAKNSKDYTGGTNHYTNLKGFMPLLEQLLG